jgi:hypothetical protein
MRHYAPHEMHFRALMKFAVETYALRQSRTHFILGSPRISSALRISLAERQISLRLKIA